jgi:hypothetical protein
MSSKSIKRNHLQTNSVYPGTIGMSDMKVFWFRIKQKALGHAILFHEHGHQKWQL